LRNYFGGGLEEGEAECKWNKGEVREEGNFLW
jgi:hypothetical protein